MSRLGASVWPLERAASAVVSVAAELGLDPVELASASRSQPPRSSVEGREGGERELGRWLELRASDYGVELEPVAIELGALEAGLARLGPALIWHDPAGGEPGLLVLDRRGRLIGPDLRRRRVALPQLAALLGEGLVGPVRADAEGLLVAAQVPARRRASLVDALVRRRLSTATVTGLWQARRPPTAAVAGQLREAGVGRSLAWLLVGHAGHALLLLGAWWLIGRGILQGRSDLGWLAAWALLLVSMVPLQLLQTWHGGLAALQLGAVLKRRLLAGALALDPDELRDRGVGRLLAMVIEAEAVEGLALSSGLLAVTAALDLAAAAWVLHRGAGGAAMLAVLGLALALLGLLAWRYAAARADWTRARLRLTHALVERMVGHTTRLAQESPARWHADEDASTAAYLRRSRRLDRVASLVEVFTRRGWMLLGAIALWPALVTGSSTTAGLAVTFAGLLLARGGFASLAAGLTDLTDLAIAWREVGPLARAGAREPSRPRFYRPQPEAHAEPRVSPGRSALDHADGYRGPGRSPVEPRPPVIEARELVHRYARRERPALAGVDFELAAGERVLLEGPSGGGKSTFAAVLAGLRRPDAGLLLLDGLDAPTHGEQGWRERVAAAPQFHQNHVLTNTFAFNLLMGRSWPPTAADLALAERVCGELGLGPLLERMPAGMQQCVGESGWQLSHGERSRVFLARALLQGAELVILDESFAALDPDNQALALACALERAPSLMVIAHP